MAYKDEHTLYLLKFNNDANMLYDECGNKWTIGKFYTEEFLRPNVSTEKTLLSYSSLAVTGTNYIETNASNFNLNNNTWTIDFWLYIPKVNASLTYLSIRGDVLIIKYNKIYIKTEDGNTVEIYNKVLLNKWFHFALVKHFSFISVYIDGVRTSYKKLYSKIKEYSDDYPNIISLGKSITNIGLRSPYNIIQFRISNNARFDINESFNPLITLGFLNFVKRKVQRTFTRYRILLKYELKLDNKQFTHDIYRKIFTTAEVYQNIQRILKQRFYRMKSDLKRRVLQLQLNIPIDTFLSNGAINLTSTCLNIQKSIKTLLELERNVKIPGYLLYYRKYLYDPYPISEPIYIMHSQFLFDMERKVYKLNKIIGPTYVPKTPDEDSQYLYYIPFPKVITSSEYDDLYEDDPEAFNYVRLLRIYLSIDTIRRTYKFEKEEEHISSDPFKINPTLYDDLYIKSPNKVQYIYAGFYTKIDLIRKVYRIEKIVEPSTEPFKIVSTDYDDKYEYSPLDNYNNTNYVNSNFRIIIQLKNDLVRKIYYIKEEYIKHEIRLTEYDKKYEYDFSFEKENKILLVNLFSKFDVCREVYKEIHAEDKYTSFTISLSEYDKKYEYDPLDDDEILREGCIFTLQIETDLVRNIYKEMHAEDNYIPHTIVPTAYDNEYEFLPLLSESIILKRIYITSKIDLIRKVYQEITISEKDSIKEIIPSEYDKKYTYDELDDDEILRAGCIFTLQIYTDLIREVYREIINEDKDSTTSITHIIIPSEYDNRYEYDPINKLSLSSHIYHALKSDLIREVYREIINEDKDSTTSITHIIIPSEYDNRYEYDKSDDDEILREGCTFTLQIEIDLLRYVENKPLFYVPQEKYKIRLNTDYHKRYRYNPIKAINKIFKIKLYTDSKRKVYKIQPLDISDYLTNTNVITDIVETLYDDNGNLISYTRVFNHKITEYDKKYFKDVEILKPSMQVYIEIEFDTIRMVQQLIPKDRISKKSIMEENILNQLNYRNVNFVYQYTPFKNVELYFQEFYDTCRTSNIDKIINLNPVLNTKNISNIEYDMNGNIVRYDRTFMPVKSQYDLKYEEVPDTVIIKLITIVEEFDTIRKIDKILKIEVNKNKPRFITKSDYDNKYEFYPISNDKINKEMNLTLIYDIVRKVTISLKDNNKYNNMLWSFKPIASEYDKKYIEDTEIIKNYTLIKISEEYDTIRIVNKSNYIIETQPKIINKTSYDNEYEFSPVLNIITRNIYLKLLYDTIREIPSIKDNNKIQQNSSSHYKTLIYILEEFETKRVNKLTDVYPLYDVEKSLYDKQYCFDKDYNPNPINDFYLTIIYDLIRKVK